MKKEFENVIWIYVHGHMVPMFDFNLPPDDIDFRPLQYLLDKLQVDKLGPMKMTLEWGEKDAA